tara:strand:+ start:76 stop:231 length:156 start_codon:yes stop_codon:yes gene_type:complete
MKRYDLEVINKEDFTTWATGKFPLPEITMLIQQLNKNELWQIQQEWIANNP